MPPAVSLCFEKAVLFPRTDGDRVAGELPVAVLGDFLVGDRAGVVVRVETAQRHLAALVRCARAAEPKGELALRTRGLVLSEAVERHRQVVDRDLLPGHAC